MNGTAWHGHATRRGAVLTGCTALVLGLTAGGAQAGPRDPARQVLGAHDGWASEGPGATGGAAVEGPSTAPRAPDDCADRRT
ncbi:hypothetical protein [Streptomyces nigra]|uniref:hypothetical protein n=1 Tax=Streptomyces nigra TaxID=1827580 RepID=UPI003F4DB233